MSDAQKGGLLLVSLFRGLSRAMEGPPLGGSGCDISEDSILAVAGRARGIAVGPTVYAQDACAAPAAAWSGCTGHESLPI